MPTRERGRGDDVVARIASYNAGREPERLAIKYRAMRESAFAFCRGTAHLFWSRWSERSRDRLDDAPVVWCCGDLHLENFGTYRGDNGLPYFDINDFDEAALAPATWELARFVTALRVAAPSLGLEGDDVDRAAGAFLTAYAESLAKGKAAWVERAAAKGVVRAMLRALRRRAQRELLDGFTVRNGRARTLRLDDSHLLPASDTDRAEVEAALATFAADARDPSALGAIDVARRVAGLGSLGLRRFVVLVRGDGSPSGRQLLDLKAAIPSSLARARGGAHPWPSEAARVVAIQHRMQVVTPAKLASMPMGDASFVLRELQPRVDRLAIAHAEGKRGALRRVLRTMGRVVAWDQLRSAARDGSASVDALIAFAHDERWQAPLVAAARRDAVVVNREWRAFARVYDGGTFG